MEHLETENHTPHQKASFICFLIFLLLVFSVNLRMAWPFALTLIMGGVLALLSHPFLTKLKKRKYNSGIASLLVTATVLLCITVPLAVLVPLSVKQMVEIGEKTSHSDLSSFQTTIDQISHTSGAKFIFGSPEALQNQIKTGIEEVKKDAGKVALLIVSSIPAMLMQFIISLITCFVFLNQGPAFLKWMGQRIPLDHDVKHKIACTFEETAVSSIWAALIGTGTQSLMMFLAFLFLGVPAFILAGIGTFFLAWIPFVGASPIWIAGTIYLYTQGSIVSLILMVIVGLSTGIVDGFIRTFMLKGATKVHPLVSLISILGGIGIFGLVGVFVGPILAAVLVSTLQIWPTVGKRMGIISASAVIEEEIPETKSKKETKGFFKKNSITTLLHTTELKKGLKT